MPKHGARSGVQGILLLALVLAAAGCCPVNDNILRIKNASSEVLLDVRIASCGAAGTGANRLNMPIFLGETHRFLDLRDGCFEILVRGDLGGVWEYEFDLGCGDDRTIVIESN
jgi:hypothetical protein